LFFIRRKARNSNEFCFQANQQIAKKIERVRIIYCSGAAQATQEAIQRYTFSSFYIRKNENWDDKKKAH
jgi:hypothetical protein